MSSSQLESIKTTDLLVEILIEEGVQFVFGIPGEENLDFTESLRKYQDKIKLVLVRHEQAAGFMAATIGRMTGQPGVALSTLGPGATNFTTCAAFAQLGGFPCLFLTGQKPIKDSKQANFQIVNVIEMMTPITKYKMPTKNTHLALPRVFSYRSVHGFFLLAMWSLSIHLRTATVAWGACGTTASSWRRILRLPTFLSSL